MDIKDLCSKILNDPKHYEEVYNFKSLLEENFTIATVTIIKDLGFVSAHARYCNILTKSKIPVYLTSPSETESCEPNWGNKIIILTCKNFFCEILTSVIITNFEEEYRLNPVSDTDIPN